MAELPRGTVTFLFTDLEGSTRLWDRYAEAARQALIRHDAVIDLVVEQFGEQSCGRVERGTAASPSSPVPRML
jgi:class 3 adenylate cyclase